MNASRSQGRADAFDVDETVAPVRVLRIKTVDVERIEQQARAQLGKLLYAPVVVDVGPLEASAMELPLHDLAERLRACKLVPVGAANLPAYAVWNAAAAGMAIVELNAAPPPEPRAADAAAEPPRAEPPPPAAPSTVTVRQPVRAGQVIRSDGDLVVLAAVNPGAQLVADGHVHVYAALRGRVVAGASGRSDARVFCQALDAELVSIADCHLLADDIPAALRGRPAQLFADAGRIRIQPL